MSQYLAQWVDGSLTVRESDTPETISRSERERLQYMHSVAATALVIPKRLGADATALELATDKRMCRRVAHVAVQGLVAWGGKSGPLLDVTREAAQVRWDRWWATQEAWLIARMHYIATWATENPNQERWAKSALVRLSNEARWLQYALQRD